MTLATLEREQESGTQSLPFALAIGDEVHPPLGVEYVFDARQQLQVIPGTDEPAYQINFGPDGQYVIPPAMEYRTGWWTNNDGNGPKYDSAWDYL
jgi:hypothetical protein